MAEQKTNLYIPVAILLAGFLVAVGVYLSGDRNLGDTNLNKENQVKTVSIKNFKEVSAEDHILGNFDAQIVIVEYSDTECYFCKKFHATMHTLIDTYGKDNKVAWVFRHFPLDSIHSKARKEAEATECANELGGNTLFWKYIDLLYTSTPSNNGLDLAKLPEFAKTVGLDVSKFNTCLSSGKYANDIEADFQSGVKIGVQGTPHAVMVLKSEIKVDVVDKIDEFAKINNLFDQQGNLLVRISDDKKMITTSGALPVEIMKSIIDMVI